MSPPGVGGSRGGGEEYRGEDMIWWSAMEAGVCGWWGGK